jgi:hypothetical protein
LRADPLHAQAMGARARADAIEHSWHRMAEGYVAVYRELAGSRLRLADDEPVGGDSSGRPQVGTAR